MNDHPDFEVFMKTTANTCRKKNNIQPKEFFFSERKKDTPLKEGTQKLDFSEC